MIGKDVHVAHRANRTGNWPILLLVISKGLRASSLFSAFKLLHELPLILFVFLVLFGSSLFFLGIQRPWNGSKKLRGKQWVRVVIYAIILVASTLLWNIGLKYYGPIRTILSSDYADFTMFYVVSTLISNSVFDSTKSQGAILIIISCLLLFFFSTTPSSGAPYGDTLYFGPFEADTIGGIALAIAVGLTIFRKGIARRLYGDIGGTKKLFSLSMGIASCVLFPFALFQYFTEPINMDSAALFSLLSVIAFVVVVDYYVESISNNQLDTSVTAQCSIIAGFLFGWVISWQYNLEGAGWLEWVCFALTIVGIRLLSGKASDAPALPLYSGSSVAPISSSQGFRHAMSILKMVIKQIVEKSTSRRIFTFLVVNLMFMFVELMYGIWTNSLGLITDAFHMLFDCTALFIALFAEVISQWDSNNVFSYGYSRVQVLSGFANGIFLVFISFYVLMESIERVMEPPDVKTDRLLLVSILGFAVNMVGIFSFHDHHHEGGEHDHGHGHSHGHGHGHGHSKEHKEKKIKNKDSHHDNCNDPKHAHGEHSHEHGHDHDHGHGHDHDHGHGHDHDHSHGHNHGHEKPHKKDKKEKAAHSHEHSENLQGVFLHLLADTLGSVGVIISSFIIQMWGWTIADPICSLFIAVLIFMSTIPLLKSASRTLMQCTPGHFVPKLDEVLGKITKLEGVLGYRDPHFWTYANNIIVGSIHIQVDEHINEQQILQTVTNMLKKKGVTHLVVEIEKPQARNRTPTMHLDHDDRPPHYSSGVDPLNL